MWNAWIRIEAPAAWPAWIAPAPIRDPAAGRLARDGTAETAETTATGAMFAPGREGGRPLFFDLR